MAYSYDSRLKGVRQYYSYYGYKSSFNSPENNTNETDPALEELKNRDRDVIKHEEDHYYTGSEFAEGKPEYDFQIGSDGKRYRIGGHVNMNMSEIEGDPKAAIRKADIIKRSALAPDEPSSQDYTVAGQADQMKIKAMQELNRQQNSGKFNSTFSVVA